MLQRGMNMKRKEAILIAEEILKILVFAENSFQENIHEYMCDRLDISDEYLADALMILS